MFLACSLSDIVTVPFGALLAWLCLEQTGHLGLQELGGGGGGRDRRGQIPHPQVLTSFRG